MVRFLFLFLRLLLLQVSESPILLSLKKPLSTSINLLKKWPLLLFKVLLALWPLGVASIVKLNNKRDCVIINPSFTLIKLFYLFTERWRCGGKGSSMFSQIIVFLFPLSCKHVKTTVSSWHFIDDKWLAICKTECME